MASKYGLIGGALSHSYSKIIHEMIGAYSYDLFPMDEETMHKFMDAKEFAALNVTIPYKQKVIPHLDYISDDAKEIGAVNTIVNKDGKLYGYNTDYFGFLYTLTSRGIKIEGNKVLVIGNGGAAKAVIPALKSLNPRELVIVKYKEEPGTVTYDYAAKHHNDAEVIVNTSPVGMYPNVDATPIDLTPYNNLAHAVDIVYNPLTTKFLAEASAKGATADNGLLMLVAQAVKAYEYFLDTKAEEGIIEKIYESLKEQI